MKYVVPQTGTRQVVTGLSLAGILIGMASPIITVMWSEYFELTSVSFAVEILGALLVPLSLMTLFFALFVSKDQALTKQAHSKSH